MDYFRGKDRYILIKKGGIFVPAGCLTENSMSESSEFIGTTTRENAGWQTKKPTKQAYTISFAGLQMLTEAGDNEDTHISYDGLKALKRSRTLIEWKIITSDYVFVDSGKAYISEIGESAPVDDWLTYSCTLEGFGIPVSQVNASRFVWRAKQSDYTCLLVSGLPSGQKLYNTLEQYDNLQSALTGEEKPNSEADADHIAPDADLAACGIQTPVQFIFSDVNQANLSQEYESNTITLSGLTLPVPLSITGGWQYSKNGEAFTSGNGIGVNGDSIKLKLTSSGSYTTGTSAAFTAGGTSDTWTVNTIIQYLSRRETGYATKSDCEGGLVGSTEEYVVTAGTFTSLVSQEDADNQAVAAVEANKQSHANSTGTCELGYPAAGTFLGSSCEFTDGYGSPSFIYETYADGSGGTYLVNTGTPC